MSSEAKEDAVWSYEIEKRINDAFEEQQVGECVKITALSFLFARECAKSKISNKEMHRIISFARRSFKRSDINIEEIG